MTWATIGKRSDGWAVYVGNRIISDRLTKDAARRTADAYNNPEEAKRIDRYRTHEDPMRHRRRRKNPDVPVETALTWLGGGAIVGAGLGALSSPDRAIGAMNGAGSGVALVGVGGLVTAIFSRKHRSEGFATAGVGLGGLALLGLAISIVRPGYLTSGTGMGALPVAGTLPGATLIPHDLSRVPHELRGDPAHR